ncbi:hypothetical protein GYMLUDRAFT_87926 [Collybiopsis luxurians FD-317 M1]|uniref:3-oxoacyl-[acyl-carrier-protein] reductase n=1 Tax=Collybiopsis luxurians FD-317 M1 TaxID=944289 RepID=A0A0D0C9T7_9AGAR|nr:hypothetical protein GYMLUDRAFT_87926 [Collybiopsis luxurians FD-317 M1]
MSLRGKIALITGCSGGIGAATALALARQGCSIAVHYSSAKDKAQNLSKNLQGTAPGVRAVIFQADLSDYDGVRQLYNQVVQTMDHPDILFNNARALVKTIGRMGNVQDVSIDEFEMTWKLNAGSGYLLTQLCLPHMVEQKYGRVVFNSRLTQQDASSHRSLRNTTGTGGVIGPHYASSKSALHGLLHWIASQHAKDGVTCNAVAPALVAEAAMMSNPSDEMRKMIPVGRMGASGEIASVVELLVTNAYMTNKIIVADGGLTASAF